jgi:acetyl esterase/lipase
MILTTIVFTLAASLPADDSPQVVSLWPKGAPGFESRRDEAEVTKPGSKSLTNIHNPSLTVFLPPKEKSGGAAVIICPGGGHRELVVDGEGFEPARYFNSIGVAAFVLKYRLGRERASPYKPDVHAREDGLRAMRLVRSRAMEWGVDPKRVGIMGFSAGGEVASFVAFGPTAGQAEAADPIDRVDARPDFLIEIYPGGGVPEKVAKDAPPAFLLVANDDRGASRAVAALFQKYRDAQAPVEAHVFARGGHGFKMAGTSQLASLKHWPDRLRDWMEDNKLLSAASRPR